MRTIKFRGKRLDGQGWVIGGFHEHIKRQLSPIGDKLNDDDVCNLIIQSGFADWNMPKPLQAVEVIPESVGQFTERYDKNGDEIYGGHIVTDGVNNYVVEFYEGCWCLRLGVETGSYHALYPVAGQREIIGNIHDNPELMEVK